MRKSVAIDDLARTEECRARFLGEGVTISWGWVDSDWAADLDSRRSHTGYILMMSGGAVSWKSRRQDCVSLSTSEAEYVAASQCGQEVVYLREILSDFGFAPSGPTRIYEDNLACVAMSENPVRRKPSTRAILIFAAISSAIWLHSGCSNSCLFALI